MPTSLEALKFHLLSAEQTFFLYLAFQSRRNASLLLSIFIHHSWLHNYLHCNVLMVEEFQCHSVKNSLETPQQSKCYYKINPQTRQKKNNGFHKQTSKMLFYQQPTTNFISIYCAPPPHAYLRYPCISLLISQSIRETSVARI